jgi:hypothetical protein
MPTIELTRFHVRLEQEQALLAARPAMLEDFQADRTGFIDAKLVRLPDHEWLDIVSWNLPEDLADSRAKGANRPGIEAFFAAIDHLVTAEEGMLVDGGTHA